MVSTVLSRLHADFGVFRARSNRPSYSMSVLLLLLIFLYNSRNHVLGSRTFSILVNSQWSRLISSCEVAGLLVVSSKDESPLTQFVDLYNPDCLPALVKDGAMDPKVLKHYVLLHDVQDGPLDE